MALTQVTGPYPIFTDLDGTPLDDGYLYIGAINQDPEQNPIQVFWDSNLTIPATQPIRTSNGYAYRNGTPALFYTGGEFSITIRNKREEFVLYSPVGYGFDPAAVSASVVKNDFIGDGVEVNFVLSASPSTKLATNVFINGVYQEKDSYTLSGNTITFSIAPPLSSSIEVMTNETGIINAGNATAISYTAGFPGATLQTVQTKLEQYVSVKDFGAVGDGVTDDTANIQDAVDAMNAANGGAIYFPAGEYLITDYITLYSDVTLFGEGKASKIHLVNSGRSDAFRATGTQPSPVNRITMRDFMLYGDTSFLAGVPSVVNGGGVNFLYTDDCTFENLWVSGFSDGGIAILNGSYNTIASCRVRFTAQGISFNANDIDVTGNVAVGNTISDTGTYNGLHLEGGFGVSPATGEVRYTTLTGNTVINSYEAGINIELAPYTACAGNSVFNAGFGATSINMGIKVFGGFSSGISGNTVRGCDGYGIVVGANSGECAVSGNATVDNGGGSLLVTDNGTAATLDVSVSGNSFAEGDLATSGNVSFKNWTPAVTFSNVASTDTQTLDWYEENTFTPTIAGSTSAGTATYAVQDGKFTRIGNRVFFELNLDWSGHTGTGNMRVAGLPYPINGAVPGAASMSSNGLAPAAGNLFSVYIPQGGVSYLEMRTIGQATGTVAAYAMQAAGVLVISGHYSV